MAVGTSSGVVELTLKIRERRVLVDVFMVDSVEEEGTL